MRQLIEGTGAGEKLLADIISFLPDATLVIDREGRVIAWNRAIEEMTGISAREMLGKGNYEYAIPFYGDRRPILVDLVLLPDEELFRSYAHIKREGAVLTGETYVSHLRGGGVYLFATASALYGSNGEIAGAIEVIRDITDRKRAEERLQRSERLLADIISFLPDATLVIDHEGRVIAWNRAMEEMTGIPAAEMLGQGDHAYAVPFYGERRPVLIDLVLRPGCELPSVYANAKRRGSQLSGEMLATHLRGGAYVFVTASPLRDANGNVVGAIEIVRDITERKSGEEALKLAKEAADAANRAKSAFLASMSHEIRTPMNAILGFSQLGLRDTTLTPTQRKYLEIITRSGEHLLGLINDILSLSRIEAGRVTLVTEPFRPRQLVMDIAEMFRMKTDAKGLELRLDVGRDVPEVAKGDEVKLRQVLLNLVGNAVKFTQGGSVGLRVDARDGLAFFEVNDTGPGIPEDERDAIFRPFVQAQSGVSAREGTGLGLAISRSFVELMGGALTVESEVGKGSTFSFRIPLPAADDEVAPRRDQRRILGIAEEQWRPRVLVADDQDENRLLLVRMLEGFGIETREARNGEEALSAWQAWRPELVLMDLRMPVLDGYEATRRIRALEGQAGAERRRTIVFACTASVFEHDREAIYAAGCDDFLGKPVREENVAEKISSHLGVKFLYDEPAPAPAVPGPAPPTVTLERLASVPGSLLASLEQALVRGDGEAALSASDGIAKIDDRLAGEIREMVGQFRSGEILDILERMPR